MKTSDKAYLIHMLTPIAQDVTGNMSQDTKAKADKKIRELIDSLDLTPKKKGGDENVTAS